MNTRNEIPQDEITELLKIPMESPDIIPPGLDSKPLLLQLARLAERHRDATGPGFLRMDLDIACGSTLLPLSILVRYQNRKELVESICEESRPLFFYCSGLNDGAQKGAGWDGLQPHLRVTWQTKANFFAVLTAKHKAA